MLNLSDDEPALITPISGSSAADITSAPSLRCHSPVGIPSRPALDRVDREEKGIDNADRIVFANEVIQTLGQQYELAAVLAFNETLHPRPQTRSPDDSNST